MNATSANEYIGNSLVQITVKYFALMREQLGISEETLDLPAGSVVRDACAIVVAKLGDLGPLVDRSMIMLNQEYVEPDHTLNEGDEVAIIPPVSGGGHFRVHSDELDATRVASHVEDPGAGAIITFSGVVRDNARGNTVSKLEYEAYPAAAEKMLAQIGDEMTDQWPLLGIAIEHRIGTLTVGETSVVIAVSSAHREAAFEASSYAIRRIKEIVPIWKKEFYEGGATWIGSEHEYQVETGRILATSSEPEGIRNRDNA